MARQDISPAFDGVAHTRLVGCRPGEVGPAAFVVGTGSLADAVEAEAEAAAGKAITVSAATASATISAQTRPAVVVNATGRDLRRDGRAAGG
jgi:hypothetical protein